MFVKSFKIFPKFKAVIKYGVVANVWARVLYVKLNPVLEYFD